MIDLEKFERFTKIGRRTNPFVTIRKNGDIAFSMGAVSKYRINYNYAILFFDAKKKRIAIKFTNDKKEEGSLSIKRRKGNFSISVRSFLKLYDIKYSETKNYGFEWHPDCKCAVFYPTDNISEKLNDLMLNKKKNYKFKPVPPVEMPDGR